MLKALGFIAKAIAFSVLVLVAGNGVKWDGRTLSEHVQAGVRQAERSDIAGKAKNWAGKMIDDAREGYRRKGAARISRHAQATARPAPVPVAALAANDDAATVTDATRTSASAEVQSPGRSEARPSRGEPQEQIGASERQKLKALIRELNSSRGRD